jgi:hypothetical protein
VFNVCLDSRLSFVDAGFDLGKELTLVVVFIFVFEVCTPLEVKAGVGVGIRAVVQTSSV